MPTRFDDYADRYTALHASSVAASGESPRYFAEYKLRCLQRLGVPATAPLLDFGSGIGNVTEVLLEGFSNVHAYDPSAASVQKARARLPTATHYHNLGDVPLAFFEAAVLSGVLHHVQPGVRGELLQSVRARLAPGGRVFVFEHNPLNPLTRRAVERCPFDDDAILLYPWQVRRALRRAGFRLVHLDYIVFFPRLLARLRRLEPRLAWCALGAQTLTVGTNPR